jgi:Xaa-Pro aminopeptidase
MLAAGKDGALLLDSANITWLTAGMQMPVIADPAEAPALFYLERQRWLLCSNVDTQRLFDEDLNDLGFQVKEWQWFLGRHTLLYGLSNGRPLASDSSFNGCTNLADTFRQLRRTRSPWDQERMRELGKAVAHAIEATCRNCERGDTEQEIAGQLSHRLIRHGITPVSIQVAVDGRLRSYRRVGCTETRLEQGCVIRATGQKHGLHATASRAVSIGPPDTTFRREYDLACKAMGVYVTACKPGESVAAATSVGTKFLEHHGHGDEWRLAPIGWVTGTAPVELAFTPSTSDTIQPNWAIVWSPSVGASLVADTYLVESTGLQCVTPAEMWPLKRLKLPNATIDCPDILARN